MVKENDKTTNEIKESSKSEVINELYDEKNFEGDTGRNIELEKEFSEKGYFKGRYIAQYLIKSKFASLKIKWLGMDIYDWSLLGFIVI